MKAGYPTCPKSSGKIKCPSPFKIGIDQFMAPPECKHLDIVCTDSV